MQLPTNQLVRLKPSCQHLVTDFIKQAKQNNHKVVEIKLYMLSPDHAVNYTTEQLIAHSGLDESFKQLLMYPRQYHSELLRCDHAMGALLDNSEVPVLVIVSLFWRYPHDLMALIREWYKATSKIELFKNLTIVTVEPWELPDIEPPFNIGEVLR